MAELVDYARHDGLGLAELVRGREVTPSELVDDCIARIEARNPSVNAVIVKLYDQARAAAKAGPSGPFAGVPFLLKDLAANLAGVPTGAGNATLAHIPSVRDSEIVRRYKAAGLIVVGKANTPEFGLAPVTEPKAFGPTRNPWDLTRTPGGSSGGSAAAVAARMAPMAHATDGGGSIRIPASCCGLVGLKPTRGRTPSGPDAGEGWRGYVVGHAVTRSVRDCAALLDASAGADVGAPYEIAPPVRPYLSEVGAPPGKLRIAFSSGPFLATNVHDDCVAGLRASVALLRGLGHELVEAAPPFERETWMMAFMTIVAAETRGAIAEAGAAAGRALRFADFETATFVIGLLGQSWSAGDYAKAARYLQIWSRRVGEFFQDFDAMLTPTIAQPPILVGALRPTPVETAILAAVGHLHAGWFMRLAGLAKFLAAKSFSLAPYTPLFNVTGQPAVSLPLHWNPQGLPIGMQLAARMGDEATLFRLAAQLEAAQPWFARAPAGF